MNGQTTPLAYILTWCGPEGGNWSDKNNWTIYGSGGAHPNSNSAGYDSVFIFDGDQDNSGVTYDSVAPQVGMTILQDGYDGVISVGTGTYGVTFNPGYFVDLGLNNPNFPIDKFEVGFDQTDDSLVFNNAGGATYLGNFDWGSGGSIGITAPLYVENGGSLAVDTISSPVTVGTNGNMFVGSTANGNTNDLLMLYSKITLQGGNMLIYQGNGGKLIDNEGTGSSITENYVYGEIFLLNPNNYSNECTINATLNINNGNVLVGGQTAGYGVDFAFNYIFMNNTDGDGATIQMNNGSTLKTTGYLQEGGDFDIMDTKPESFYVRDKTQQQGMQFLGGIIDFLGDPNSNGDYNSSLNINGNITMDGVTIDMNWDGGIPGLFGSDFIQDPDQTTSWKVTSNDTIDLNEYGVDENPPHSWSPFRSFTALDNTGGDPTVHNIGQTITPGAWNLAGWFFTT